jgi:ElaB/YqjD/DUF883 family membrane-anchored ribosome-binding protein
MAAETEELYRAGRQNGGGARDAIREASREARAEVSQEVHKLIDEVENLIRRAEAATDPELRRLSGEVQSAIADTKKALGDRVGWMHRAKQAKEALEASARYVREQPWQTAGIAAVTGLLVGCLISSRSNGNTEH